MEKESALYQKISAFVEELFHTHCDIAAAPDTVRFYAGAVVAGQLSIEAASKQIAELGMCTQTHKYLCCIQCVLESITLKYPLQKQTLTELSLFPRRVAGTE